VWLATDNRVPLKLVWLPWVAFALTIYAGVTMVSNAPFYSGKALDVRFRVPFAGVLLVVVAFVLVSSDPPSDVVRIVRLVRFFRLRMVGVHGYPRPAESGQIV
jgi:CDP-diacylglycerol--serine O-phosphatidyltransferase